MPLPHFLILLLAVMAGAGLTIWLAIGAEIKLTLLTLVALGAATVTHLLTRHRSPRHSREER